MLKIDKFCSVLTVILLGFACNTPPASAPPVAKTSAPPAEDPSDDADAGGFASPPPGSQEPPDGPPNEPPNGEPNDPELARQVVAKFGDECRLERLCGELVGIDCNAAADGPYYYARKASLEVVATCGGACMAGCRDCPPPGWTCATY